MALQFDDPSVVFNIKKGMILEASAGSGKTTVLTERWLASFIYLIVWEQKSISEALRGLTALTFTRKAATEMKMRIRSRIDELWEGNELKSTLDAIAEYEGPPPHSIEQIKFYLNSKKENIDDLLSSAVITTINSYVLNLLRSYPLELDSDIGLNPEEGAYDVSATEKEAQLQVLRSLLQEEFPKLAPIFQLGVSLVGLSKWVNFLEQQRKLISQYGEDAIKKALEASSYFQWNEELLKIAQEEGQKEKIYNLIKPSINAFLEIADREIAFNGKLTNGNDTIYHTLKQNNSEDLLTIFSKDLLGVYKLPTKTQKEELNALREDSHLAYQVFLDNLYKIIVPLIVPISNQCSKVLKELQAQYGEISFGESEILLLESFKKNNFLSKIHSQMRFFFADEFQDTSDVQKEMFDLIIKDDRVVPFFVGDPKQAIYSFRKANVYVFDATVKEFEARDYNHKLLNTNYRSASSHVSLVNYLFENIFAEDYSKINYTPQLAHKEQEGTFLYTLALEKEGKEKILTKDYLERAYYDALYLLDKMLKDNIAPQDIMILFRNRNSILEFYMLSKKYYPSLPLSSSVRNILWDNHHITPLLSFLRVLVNPHHNLTLISLLKSPLFRKNDVEINLMLINAQDQKLSLWDVLEGEEYHVVKEFIVLRDRISLEELLSLLIKELHYEDFLYAIAESGDALATLSLFVEEAQKLQEKRDMSLSDFISYIDQKKQETEEASFSGENALRLMTVHSSKGLESPHVIYIHKYNKTEAKARYPLYLDHKIAFDILGKGLIATSLGENALKETLSEEKRLAYVAVTRAKESFYFCALSSKAKNDSSDFETQWASFLNQELIAENPTLQSNKLEILEDIAKREESLVEEDNSSYTERHQFLEEKDKVFVRQELPQFLSVSLLLDAEFNKDQFYDKYIRHSFNLIDSLRELSEEEFVLQSPSPMDIGNIVHILLQKFDVPEREDVLNYLHIHHLEQEEAFDLVLSYAYAYWESDFYQNLIKGTVTQEKERQVLYLLPNDIMMRATSDLYVSSEEDKHTIVDYKLSIGKNISRYHRQLSYYALLSEKSGYRVDELVLFDLKEGKERILLWNKKETEKAFDDAIQSAMNYLTNVTIDEEDKDGIDWEERRGLFS